MVARLIDPHMIRRVCGGWLAVSPLDSDVRIGVTGLTEDEARAGFARSLVGWDKCLALRGEHNREVPINHA